jgi:hypothetical protein
MKLTTKEVICILSSLDTALDHASEEWKAQKLMYKITEKLEKHYDLSVDAKYTDWAEFATMADDGLKR